MVRESSLKHSRHTGFSSQVTTAESHETRAAKGIDGKRATYDNGNLMATLTVPRTRPRLFYGWYIVGVAFLANAIASGISAYAFGLFMKPMSLEFGWNRSIISSVFAIKTAATTLVSPIYGMALDRKNSARLLMTFGGLMGGMGLFILSFTHSLAAFYLGFGVLWGLGVAALDGGLVTSTLVSKWFVRRRGRALAVSLMGVSLGGAILVPITGLLIAQLGWRGAWAALGLIAILLVVPASLLVVRRSPEDVGMVPDGDPSLQRDAPSSVAAPKERSLSLKQAAREPSLWIILMCFSLSGMVFSAIPIHIYPYVTDKGYSPVIGATVLTMIGVTGGVVKPAWGLLGERFPVRYLLVACFLIAAVSLVLLVTTKQGPLVLLFPVLYATGGGGLPPLTSLVWADYFGRKSLGSIRGVFAPVSFAASGLAPVLAGYIYDTTRSYDLFYIIGTFALLMGAIGMLLARPPKGQA